MERMIEFKVGDSVAIYTRHGSKETVSLACVERVLKTCVILQDGTRWNLRGYPLGNKNTWSFSQIKPVSAEEIVKIHEQQMLEKRQRKIIAHINEWTRTSAQIPPGIINALYDTLFPTTKAQQEIHSDLQVSTGH